MYIYFNKFIPYLLLKKIVNIIASPFLKFIFNFKSNKKHYMSSTSSNNQFTINNYSSK